MRFLGFWGYFYSDMVLFEWLDEMGSKLRFQTTREKVKSDLKN